MNTVRIQEQTALRLMPIAEEKNGAAFARRLCSTAGYGGAVFAPTGAEAKAQAVALARACSAKKYGPGRDRVLVVTEGSFDLWLANAPDYAALPAGDGKALAQALDGSVCALVFSFWTPDAGALEGNYVKELLRLCRSAGVLTISDETALGLGRTGSLLAGECYGVKPDLTVVSRGLPFGLCLVRGGLETESGSFAPPSRACAEAMELLDGLLLPGALENIAQTGQYLKEKLCFMPGLCQVRGLGLALSALPKTKDAAWAAEAARDLGLAVEARQGVLVLLPDLKLGKPELAQKLVLLYRILSAKE